MKLSKLNIKHAVNEGVEIDILMVADLEYAKPDGTVVRLAEGDPSGIKIKIRGTDSDIFRTLREKSFGAKLKKKAGNVDAAEALAEVERNTVDAMVALTVGWSGIEDDEGLPIAFSEAEARKLYSDEGYRWIRDQVDVATNDRRRFFVT